jgi:hypothetical protein
LNRIRGTTAMGFFGGSTLKLCYVIMSEKGRFWLSANCWGAREGNDMYDAQIFSSRREAEKTSAKLDGPSTIFEIGLYNGKPVMLVDAYEYWIDANYTKSRKT